MSVANWWGTRRYGLFVHANLATVPAWAPIGQYAEWYQSHLGEPVPDVLGHPSPMAEVLAHHRERWGHIARVDDFWPLLTYDRFDADAWVDLMRDAGMSYTVLVAKHHDGLCWWDAPGTARTVRHEGPRRDVVREVARACAAGGVVFGTYYSLLDWADRRYPGDAYVDEVLHPQVLDLVERYGSAILWGDGHWGHGPERWRSEELIARARALQPELVVNDRWRLDEPDVVTYELRTPDDIVDRPWELCRGIAHSFGHNRAERAEHHMTAHDIVALLSEVVAKGGHLLLNVGPAADGTIPELQATPLRRAGVWVHQHLDLIEGARPWTTWGDDHVRYLVPADDPDAVDAVVVGETRLDALGRPAGRVTSVTSRDGAAIDWAQDDAGLRIRRTDRTPTGLAPVYRVHLEPAPDAPVELFEPAPPAALDVGERLAGATPGTIVQLGDGLHAGPLEVPAGVTLRGYGHDRTIVEGDGPTVVHLAAGARLEHLRVRSPTPRRDGLPRPLVRADGDRSVVLGCNVEGHVEVAAGTDDVKVRATSLTGVVATDATRVAVSRCRLRGMRWDTGVELTGGYGHVIDSCELLDHLAAIRLTATTDATVRGNVITARWWAIHLVDTEASHVYGNAVAATMRAVDVDGGTLAEVSGNAVADGDSGCVVQRGAADTTVSGNRWERCRIGLLAWDAGPLAHHGNAAIDLHEPDRALTVGP